MLFELKMAWRETRAAAKKFVFMVVAIALGVGALTGIKGFSSALDRAMSKSARDLIASDFAVRMNAVPGKNELAVLESLVQRGAVMTQVTQTLSMAASEESAPPLLSNLKAVDPQFYPFYGNVELDPPQQLRDILKDDTAVVSQDFLTRAGTSVGRTVQVGTTNFRIAAVLKSEPDRLSSGIDLGPRILITRKALQQTGLIQFGSRTSESFLYRLPERGLSLDQAKRIINQGMPRAARIVDYRDPNPSLSRGLERTANYLSLIGLLAVLLSGLGVAMTIHSYLQQKLDHIAILKCLGGRSARIIRIYLIQGMILGVAGSILGVGLGYGIQLLFPMYLQGLINLPTDLQFAPGAIVQGFLIGIITTLLFLLPPLLAIQRVRPARVFLREMPDTQQSMLRRLSRDRISLVAGLLLLIGIGLLASWLADSLRWGFAFLGGLAGSIAVLSAGAKLLLQGLKKLPRASSLPLRHGIKNLNRPGNHITSVLVALGIGVAFILTVYFIQTSLLAQLVKAAPADYPNVFLLGVTDADKLALGQFLKSRPGIVEAGTPIPMIPARLRRVDSKTAEELGGTQNDRRYFQHEFSLTWAEDLPPDSRILQGKWWQPPYVEPMISVEEHAAERMNLGVGSTLEFESSGKLIKARVASIRRAEFDRPGTSNQFLFSPGSLEGLPASYVGTIRMEPSAVAALQKELFARFPNVTSIDVGQVLVRVQELLDKIASIIRFVALFAILAGTVMLASSVMATRYQRVREAVILKTLGATRSQVSRIQAAEFLIVGLVAGFIGGLLAAIAAHYLLGNLLNTVFEFKWAPLLIGTVATAALAIATGWIASRGIMNHRPLEVLREN